jgi:hypothetical protein
MVEHIVEQVEARAELIAKAEVEALEE